MHELSIATAILDQVRSANRTVLRVGVRVGELAGVDPEALAFGFQCLAQELAVRPELVIEPAAGDDLHVIFMDFEERPPSPVLQENNRIAAELRRWFEERGVLCLNVIGSPGAGKTALLERTLATIEGQARAAVLAGDIQTDYDARRLARFGFPVKQIATGGTCHLDARMIWRALEGWKLADLDLLFIENVGNLVCPSSYDLGESAKVVVLSVTEGEEKPLKYPAIFRRAALAVFNKMDLAPHVPFDLARARDNARRMNPAIEILELSCVSGEGLEGWRRWLSAKASKSAALSRA